VTQNKTVAVIDVGSNSIKLLVARYASPEVTVEAVFTKTIETRISAGISRSQPELTPRAMEQGLASIREILRLANTFEPAVIRLVATSAVRDATNGMEWIDRIRDKTGQAMQILSGTEEARYIGCGLACDPQLKGLNSFLQMDLGGGSLELVRFSDNQIEQAISLQLGSVRLTEALLTDRDAPLDSTLQDEISAQVNTELTETAFDFKPLEWPLLITGGAATVTRAILAARAGQSIDEIPPFMKLETLSNLRRELAALPLHERLAIPHLPARRADILPTALITIESVLKYAQRDTTTHSFYNLRYGVAHEALKL
jgi:exopolyphosphatase/guanosine-5'-triphosphate,3'-diphosphate pyrophosphatase